MSQHQTASAYMEWLLADRRFLEMGVWHNFYIYLTSLGAAEPIPPPLILAANIASPCAKLARLGEQLEWAERNGTLGEATAWLDGLADEQWSLSDNGAWSRGSEVG